MWKNLLSLSSKNGTKIRPVNNKKSNLIWYYYAKGYDKKRIFVELTVPIILTSAVLLVFYLSDWELSNILDKIKEIIEYTATIIALQIGFNITSLAIISSFNSEAIRNTFSKVDEDKKEQALKQLLSSFVYCILIQTWLIIIGTVYNASYESIVEWNKILQVNPIFQTTIVFLIFFIWMSLLFHSFVVFYRNVILIYKFTLINIKK